MAEFYLRQAAFLRKKDLDGPSDLKLLARNSQKRLFIGIGIELLLKAVYLKNGYAINKPCDSTLKLPFTFQQAHKAQLKDDDTFTLNQLIDQFGKVENLASDQSVMKGLRIAKVFRNKEGHSVTEQHAFDASNYQDIECALRMMYCRAFGERIKVRFSLAPNETPLWHITPCKSP